MAFPTPSIKTKNYAVTPEVATFLEKRLATLGRLMPKAKKVVCEVELNRLTKQKAGKIYRAEVNIDLGDRLVRAEAVEETMENAIDHVKNELKIELTKVHTKVKTQARAGARKAKEMVQKGRTR